MHTGGRCYACFRPAAACFCASIPTIHNRTAVLILQHRREAFHRFNTARIVHRALRNSELVIGQSDNLGGRVRLKPRAGLLFPGPMATLISDLPASERPEQLVVVDGTWHHAKTMLRDIPALGELPRYQLAPSEPSRYRIRREPNTMSLSTVEAAVAALRILEPETEGFDQLLGAFDQMVDVQLAHPGSERGARFKARGRRTFRNIPRALHGEWASGDLANIVVAYGEAPQGQRGRKRVASPPIVWVARRLGDGADFACTLIPPEPLSDTFLGHLELTRAHFDAAISLDEARRRWAEFQRPGDLVAVFHSGTARLFSYLSGEHANCLVLNSIDVKSHYDQAASEEGATTLEDVAAPAQTLGRASKRLAQAILLVRMLNALANHENYYACTKLYCRVGQGQTNHTPG